MNALRQVLVLLVLVLASGFAHAAMSSKPLQAPQPVAIPAGASNETVVKSIRAALIARGWAVASERPGYVEGLLTVREHMLKVGITYGGGNIVIKYLDSTKLGYEIRKGVEYIHPKFTNWTNNLALDIRTNLALN